jgi:hypothetical protein
MQNSILCNIDPPLKIGAGGWWLVAGGWLLNFQFVFNDPRSQEELGT